MVFVERSDNQLLARLHDSSLGHRVRCLLAGNQESELLADICGHISTAQQQHDRFWLRERFDPRVQRFNRNHRERFICPREHERRHSVYLLREQRKNSLGWRLEGVHHLVSLRVDQQQTDQAEQDPFERRILDHVDLLQADRRHQEQAQELLPADQPDSELVDGAPGERRDASQPAAHSERETRGQQIVAEKRLLADQHQTRRSLHRQRE